MRTAVPFALAAAWSFAASAQDAQQRFHTDKADVVVETVAKGLENPWGLAFLPDGRMLVTERSGRLRVVEKNRQLSSPVGGLPQTISVRGQGGLLDVVLDPRFAQNRLVYLSFAENRSNGRAGTSVLRGHLNAAADFLDSTRVIFRQEPAHTGGNHFGSRLVFDRDGHLFVTVGDRFDLRREAQNPGNHLGKILRITTDGKPAPGNPFLDREGTAPEIWSLGHRNVQGAALDPRSGRLFTAEHGARGGDEINQPQAGRNYGWPVITYGVDYSGATIGEGTAKAGMEQPLYFWDPSIAPSGLSFYTGDRFPGWRNSVFVGALAGKLLARLEVSGGRITGEERMLQGLGERIRDVRQGPDGLLYLLTDAANGRVLRLKPAT